MTKTTRIRMVRRIGLLVGAIVAAALLAQDVSAQCGYRGHGGSRYGGYYGGNFYGGGGYGATLSIGYRPVYRAPAHTWHDTSHWDYEPNRYVPHGDHVDHYPGGYRWHPSGHVDHHH